MVSSVSSWTIDVVPYLSELSSLRTPTGHRISCVGHGSMFVLNKQIYTSSRALVCFGRQHSKEYFWFVV